jgi:Family of unknown function (DUF6151)
VGRPLSSKRAPTDVSIRCACGALRGTLHDVSGDYGNRVVCYCDDCQSFAYFLGGTDKILDAHGGTEVFQTSPVRIELTSGLQHLACLSLKPGGLIRWYADCCRTPIGNTVSMRQVPFVGVIHSCTPVESKTLSRDEVFGPVRARIHARFAKGDRSLLEAHERVPVSVILRFMWTILGARLRGDHARSPFFDAKSGALFRTPRVLTTEELRAVEAERDH